MLSLMLDDFLSIFFFESKGSFVALRAVSLLRISRSFLQHLWLFTKDAGRMNELVG